VLASWKRDNAHRWTSDRFDVSGVVPGKISPFGPSYFRSFPAPARLRPKFDPEAVRIDGTPRSVFRETAIPRYAGDLSATESPAIDQSKRICLFSLLAQWSADHCENLILRHPVGERLTQTIATESTHPAFKLSRPLLLSNAMIIGPSENSDLSAFLVRSLR